MTILEAHNMPFAAALVLMALLAILQVVGLADALGAETDVDAELDGNGAIQPGALDGMFTVLGLGRVPLTIWLALYLFAFAAVGVSVQALAQNLTDAPLDRWLAAVIAAGLALPVTGTLVRPLGAVLPQDETSAVGLASLVGRRARITDGVARKGSPARAQVRDIHGHAHHVMVEPHEEASELHAGDDVLLVRREGQHFFATALAERRLSPTD